MFELIYDERWDIGQIGHETVNNCEVFDRDICLDSAPSPAVPDVSHRHLRLVMNRNEARLYNKTSTDAPIGGIPGTSVTVQQSALLPSIIWLR